MEFWPLYLVTGIAAGGLAGLLGVGGGLVIVPALVFIFPATPIAAEHVQHFAIATSLASILFTSIASVRAHHRRGAVNWRIAGKLAPGILAGSLVGSWFAAMVAGKVLTAGFVIFICIVALQMLFEFKPTASRSLPGTAGMSIAGALIGAASSLLGIGGGSLSVPFMTWCNVKMREAIGTSALLGFPIALAGSAGFAASGMAQGALPPGSLGFVYLPALGPLALASVLAAPAGAALAHRIPASRLQKIFAVMLLAIAFRMTISLLQP